MAITEHYSILHDLPLFHDHEAMELGRHKIEFHPEMPTRLGVIPRYGAGGDPLVRLLAVLPVPRCQRWEETATGW